jgi:WD40 repeat protein
VAGEDKFVAITKMRFDPTQRRLITASREGLVRIWNFNNGALLRELEVRGEEEREVGEKSRKR